MTLRAADETDARGRGGGRVALPSVRVPLEPPYAAMYGSDAVAAAYCGLRRPPAPPRGLWMHGWYPERRPLDRPERLFDVTMAHLGHEPLWVTTERQARFLRGLGYTHARAIGLPLVYLPPLGVPREPDSLLVMPTHSLPSTHHAWEPTAYVEAIESLRPHFGRICVCVNGHDWARGRWVNEFRAAGFEVIRGAGSYPSLRRVAALFAGFDYVTTNGMGSLLAYGSAFGAKVSLFGPFVAPAREALKNVPYYIDNPGMLDADVEFFSEGSARLHFPEFFCHPRQAVCRVAWGRSEIGWDRRVPPRELRQLFGWAPLDVARTRAQKVVARAGRAVPRAATVRVREMLSPALREAHRERTRLEAMAEDEPGRTPLFGAEFAFADARAFLREYDTCFEKHTYRFRAESEQPTVVDASAGVGMAVLYFKSLYPRCRVVALEDEPSRYGLLERNCRTFALEDTTPVRACLLSTPAGGAGAARLSAVLPGALAGEDARVDVLKLRVCGAQGGTLRDVTELLERTESVIVDYRDRIDEPQGLCDLLEVLQDCGFRVAVQSPGAPARHPLLAAAGVTEADLRVMGYRTS